MQKHLHVIKGEPEPATPEAETATPEYDHLVDELLAEISHISFNILVWGPGVHSESIVAEKRREIYHQLKADKHKCQFSEELKRPRKLSLQSLQLKQARKSDLIVLLIEATAPGAIGEMHDFCQHKELLNKMLIFYPKDMAGTYNGQGLVQTIATAFRNVEYYEEIDITSCNVKTTVLQWIEAHRHYQYSTPISSGG